MSFFTLTSAAFLFFIGAVVTQEAAEALPTFGDVVPILGRMERTDQDFQSGLALDLFSPKNRTVVVNRNENPLPGNFVSGTTGEPFVALSNFSYVVKVNDSAQDLIAKIEIPWEPESLLQMGVTPANTYVGQLSADGKSWTVDESRRNVHMTENNTRIIKMNSLDGEFILLGRQTADSSNIFVQYGFGATRTVNFTGGDGTQYAEFVDGLRLSATVSTAMMVNINLLGDVTQDIPSAIPPMEALNSFAYSINTTTSGDENNGTDKIDITFPFNNAVLASKSLGNTPNSSAHTVAIARRPLAGVSGEDGFQIFSVGRASSSATEDGNANLDRRARLSADGTQLMVEGLDAKQIDGTWTLLIGSTVS